MKIKKITSDIVFNIIASTTPIIILQFLIMPAIAGTMTPESYGLVLTLVGLMNLLSATLGNVLNNSRLISNELNNDKKVKGDYSILHCLFIFINIIFMSIGLRIYGKDLNLLSILLIIVTSVFLVLIEYGRVEFRLKLNFISILLDSLFLITGYGVGYLLFIYTGYWELIFLLGYITSFLFIINKTEIYGEPFVKTTLFKNTASQTALLLISGFILGFATYLDRLLLYPIMGGATVSVYYTATLIGKTILLFMQPIAGVFLSYLAQMKRIEQNSFLKLVFMSVVFGIIGYGVSIIFSIPLLSFLYPQFIDSAMEYIYIATLAVIIIVVCNMLNPVVLRFCHSKWQIFINASYLLIYVILSLNLLRHYGLMGFITGTVIAGIYKFFAILFIYQKTKPKCI